MQLTFLGTASAMPSRTRNVSGLALAREQRRDWWLFDCGEGTQHQLLRVPALSIARLSRVFVSHLHGDHCFGLPGLLCSRAMHGGVDPVELVGPPGLRAYLDGVVATTLTRFPFDVVVTEVDPRAGAGPGVGKDDTHDLLRDDIRIRPVAVAHAEPALTLAWIVDELPRPGRLRVERLDAIGVPPGPLYGELKAGRDVTLGDGRMLRASELLDPPRPGRTLALVFDTDDARPVAAALADLGHDTVDLLLHEATYLERVHGEVARKNRHSTAADAARLATRVGARRLALHHFSPRYDLASGDEPRIADLVDEARTHFAGDLIAASDLDVLDIPPAG